MALVVGAAVGNVTLHVLTWSHLRRITRVRPFYAGALSLSAAKDLVNVGAGMFGAQLASMLYQPLNRVCAARFAGVESVALVDLSFTASLQVRALLEAGFRSLTPEMSKAAADGVPTLFERARRLRVRSLAIVLLVGIPLFAAAILLAPLIMRTWLRNRFRPEVVPVVRVMLGAAFVGLLHVPAYYTLLGVGRVGAIVGAHVAQALANAAVIAALVTVNGGVSVNQIAVSVLGGTFSATVVLLLSEQAWMRSMSTKAREATAQSRAHEVLRRQSSAAGGSTPASDPLGGR